MKILVLQLARLGDIYMTWPALRGLRRQYPEAEIHLLVRPRFAAATEGLEAVDQVRLLPTTEFLAPVMQTDADVDGAVGRVQYYLETLKAEGFDRIVNLSYSPVSSWIVKSISTETTEVQGYTRHADGWLSVADDVSAFYHAQGGVTGASRVHLTDLFASVLNVDLIAEDWQAPVFADQSVGEFDVILHPGASENAKTVSAFHWGRLIRRLHDLHPQARMAMIGTANEAALAESILQLIPGTAVENLVGSTKVRDLFPLIGRAKLVIGGDSVAMHIGSLTGTPCFNLSIGPVNPYETGPRSGGSWILRADSADLLKLEEAGQVAADLLNGVIPRVGFSLLGQEAGFGSEFAWGLVRALYLGDDFPVVDDLRFVQAAEKLHEMNATVVEQLRKLSADDPFLANLLDRADEVLDAVVAFCPEAGVLVRWLKTEKTRIPPQDKAGISARMLDLHEQFGKVLRLYVWVDEPGKEGDHGPVQSER